MNDALTSRSDRLRELERAIAQREVLLELAALVEQRRYRRSDRGWMVSMFTLEAGTMLAVLSGRKARRLGSLVRSLELDLVTLKMERALLRDRERERALGQ